MVVHEFRQRPARYFGCAGLRQCPELIIGHRRVDRRAFLLPVWYQFVQREWIKHRARQNVRSNFAAFFENADGHFAVVFCSELLQANCGGQARWPRAYDHYIVFHRVTVGSDAGHVCLSSLL